MNASLGSTGGSETIVLAQPAELTLAPPNRRLLRSRYSDTGVSAAARKTSLVSCLAEPTSFDATGAAKLSPKP